ncbi:MAG: DivIVA domain-containing protein [Bacteroidota bacterium]|jgi:cell division initiation protein
MKLTPVEVKKQEFKKVFRGYDPEEVLAFLDTIATEMDESLSEQRALADRAIELETQLKDYKSIEKAIQQTLMQAQETSAKSMENTRQEAQLILKEAELKAFQMLDKARNDLTVLKEQLTILKAKKDSIVARLKMLLNSELELIRALEVDEELQTKSSTEPEELSKEKQEIEEIIRSLEQ